MDNDEQSETINARLDAAKAAVDAAAKRHAQSIAGVLHYAAGTVNTGAKAAVLGALLATRYATGFARGLVTRPNWAQGSGA